MCVEPIEVVPVESCKKKHKAERRPLAREARMYVRLKDDLNILYIKMSCEKQVTVTDNHSGVDRREYSHQYKIKHFKTKKLMTKINIC
jgi:hypothetical protein